MTIADATELVRYSLFIGGEWTDPSDGTSFESVDPFRGTAWAEIPSASAADVDRVVAAARAAFDEGEWPRLPGKERARLMRRLAELLRRDSASLAATETRDNGKLLREMSGQLAIMPEWYEYFAGWADKLVGDVLPTDRSNFLVYSVREPIGVVGAITAWNSPLLLATFKLAPALAAGCTVVIKPAEQTSASTLEFARLIDEAGFPPGVVNVVTGDGSVGELLVKHPGVDKIAFTGSTETGIRIAKNAADHLARVSLELGGKSANVIFADADLQAAVNGIVSGIFAATGQTCLAGSRLLIERPVFEQVVELVAARAREIKLGDPSDETTEMGPVAFPAQLDKVLGYIQLAVEEGATVAVGGGQPKKGPAAGGLFVEPTILCGLPNSARVAQEEIFGPVACAIPFDTEEEAVALANDVRYGLAAGVWTDAVARAHRVAGQIRAGTVWINAYRVLSPYVPFGGFKMSGYGRENGLEAMKEYTESKSIWVELSGQTRDPFRLG